ncbi:hypothetical protein CEXT_793301 [Caerostris extrusa]|uniref:Uncharacterized protein n=1 Tax=Caerostris extrusa TaxID=172846 RepID=A0AAV4SUL0_CAEEX|nr:hypothetical protein CEXT_793301 [Caerostris extrusa]
MDLKFSNYLARNLACSWTPRRKESLKKKKGRGEKRQRRREEGGGGESKKEAGCIGSIDKLGYTLDNASRFIILTGGADKLDSPIGEAHLFYFIYLWHDQGSTIVVIFAPRTDATIHNASALLGDFAHRNEPGNQAAYANESTSGLIIGFIQANGCAEMGEILSYTVPQ